MTEKFFSMCGVRTLTTVSVVTVGPCIGTITSCGPSVVTDLRRSSVRRLIYRDLPIPARLEVTNRTYDLKKSHNAHLAHLYMYMTHLSGSTAEATPAPLDPFLYAYSGHLLK